jgi:hypothetical protein
MFPRFFGPVDCNEILQMSTGEAILRTCHDRSDEDPRSIAVSPLTLFNGGPVSQLRL